MCCGGGGCVSVCLCCCGGGCRVCVCVGVTSVEGVDSTRGPTEGKQMSTQLSPCFLEVGETLGLRAASSHVLAEK